MVALELLLGWISGFRWEINGEKLEIHFVHCCANVPNVTVSWLAASRRDACSFLCRLPVLKILNQANPCCFTEATKQNENCHELWHCDSDNLTILFENIEVLEQRLLGTVV